MKYIITNIEYDTYDDPAEIDLDMVKSLPETLEINVPDSITDIQDIDDYLSDEISNITGFCHKGFVCNQLDN